MSLVVTIAGWSFLVTSRTQKTSILTPTIVNAKIGSCRAEKQLERAVFLCLPETVKFSADPQDIKIDKIPKLA